MDDVVHDIQASEEPPEVEELEECDGCGRADGPGEFHDLDTTPDSGAGDALLCGDCFAERYTVCVDCEDCIYRFAARYFEDDAYCRSCFHERFSRCEDCREYAEREFMAAVGDGFVCESCCENSYLHCESCGDLVHDSEMNEYNCDGCRENFSRLSRDVAAHLLRGNSAAIVERFGPAFGVEIETEFGGYPHELGEYHSGHPAGPEFFGGWKAEEDSSLRDGGEFISPVFGGARGRGQNVSDTGAAGLAEIIATQKILRGDGAEMSHRCGQHTSVSADYSSDVSLVAVALEEALYASSAAYSRMMGDSTYAMPIKGSYSPMSGSGGHHSCSCRSAGRVEFRYPPGTLSAPQVAINIGLCRAMVAIAGDLGTSGCRDLATCAMEIEGDSSLAKAARVHLLVLLGLHVFRLHGWRAGGDFNGLPYDPSGPVEIRIQDYEFGKTRDVLLPDEAAILKRLRRQISRFYRKMAANLGCAETPARMRDALAVLDGAASKTPPSELGDYLREKNLAAPMINLSV